jgi:hypothetical protein
MARRTAPTLPGWGPIAPPASPRDRGAAVARWWWPALVVVGFLFLVAYVLGHDQGPGRAGPSNRGLLVVALAVVVIVVLTVRRRYGPRALLATLAEYAVVAVLVASLVALSAPDAPARRGEQGRARRPAPARVEAQARPTEPSNVIEWVVDAWRRAGEQADRQAGADPAPPPEGGTP